MSTYRTIEAILRKDVEMSKAQICDRCGKVYSPNKLDWPNNRIPHKIKSGYDFGKDTDYVTSDLCQDCSQKFENFMNMQEPIEITRTDNTDHNEEEC